MPPVSVIQNHMASRLVVEDEAGFLKYFHCLTARDDRKRSHLRCDTHFYGYRGTESKVLDFADFNDALDCLLDVF